MFYATASDQLDQLRKLIDEVDDNEFLAKLAVYSRERAYMKDMPAALLVTLSTRDTALNSTSSRSRLPRFFFMERSPHFSTVFEPPVCKSDHDTTSIFRLMKKPRPKSARGEASPSSCESQPKPCIVTATSSISPPTASGSSTPCRQPT